MGMAASQARFLQLTGRKTNIEYMGQQINQQRLALANQSAGLFEKMLTMEPPVPPSSLDDKYYTQGYTFTDPTDDVPKKMSWLNVADTQAAFTAGTYTGTDTININWSNTTTAATGTETSTYDLDALFNDATNSVDGEGTDVSDGTGAGGAAYSGIQIDDELETVAANIGVVPQSDTSKMVVRMVNIEHSIYDPNGDYQTVNEIVPAILEFDALERLINVTPMGERTTATFAAAANPGDWADFTAQGNKTLSGNIGTGESLTYSGQFDELTFNDDMNEYEFQKAAYDYQIERINLETAKIQKQDKSLELKMKQLDTEHKAISTEMDAVSKVIQKSIDSTFKTFG